VRRFDVITFDCYGTLIDWERGIGRAFTEAAGAAGHSISPQAAVRAHAAIEPRVEADGFRSYYQVLSETARQVAEQLGWSLTAGEGDFLPASLPSWPPFPDTNDALRRLSDAGYTLGILSNVDNALLDATLRHFPVRFDVIVTAQQVRSYKPAHGHFLTARDRIGQRRWLHAAQSYFHDVVPAKQIGIPVAWVNRKGEEAGAAGPPLVQAPDLARLADWAIEG
jgi:2-haloalkanoic acid dehalogenase type II